MSGKQKSQGNSNSSHPKQKRDNFSNFDDYERCLAADLDIGQELGMDGDCSFVWPGKLGRGILFLQECLSETVCSFIFLRV
jgi:hypothetical protein